MMQTKYELPSKNSSIDKCNFIYRILYKVF